MDLARAKSEALVKIYSLLKQNINEKSQRKPVVLISQKKKLCTCSTLFFLINKNNFARFFSTFLCRCFERIQHETFGNFPVTRFMEEMLGAFHLGKKPGNFGGSKSGISDW